MARTMVFSQLVDTTASMRSSVLLIPIMLLAPLRRLSNSVRQPSPQAPLWERQKRPFRYPL
jgi:hypothetical protein